MIIGLGIAVVLPVMALVIGAGVLGSEIDDGTVAHILAKPLPRSEIVFSKLAVAFVVTSVTVGVPLYVVGLIAGSSKLATGLVVGTLLGSRRLQRAVPGVEPGDPASGAARAHLRADLGVHAHQRPAGTECCRSTSTW